MKFLSYISALFASAMLISCSGDDEPEYPVFMQPSAITSTDAGGANQTFGYDEYGRIIEWTLKSNDLDEPIVYIARYSYPDDKTICIKSEESVPGSKRCLEETLRLVNGRAAMSEGSLTQYVNNIPELRRSYRLEYEYDPSNHLTVVRHSEVAGTGDDIKGGAWEKPWTWENHLIWKDGNLEEFRDFQGGTTPFQTTEYDYSTYAVENPVVIPLVIIKAHHNPLFMQGVFGRNSLNLVKSASVFNREGRLYMQRLYTYEFEQARIVGYTETSSLNTVFSDPITYKVFWTGNFMSDSESFYPTK